MIIDYAVTKALEAAQEHSLKLVNYGVTFPYTYVLVEGRRGRALGMALTPFNEFNDIEYCEEPPISEWNLRELIVAAKSYHLVAKTLGVAAINAVSQYLLLDEDLETGDVLKVLKESLEPGSRIAIVGYLKNLIEKLRSENYELIVFERSSSLRRMPALPDFLEPRMLRDVDAAVITGATLVNETLDVILHYLNKNAYPVILAGPTAQMHKAFLPKISISHIVSVKITNPGVAIEWLKRSAAKGIREAAQKYVLKLGNS